MTRTEKEISELPVKLIMRYMLMYNQYIRDNGLEDDCKTISIKDLIDFIEIHMSKEDKEYYLEIN